MPKRKTSLAEKGAMMRREALAIGLALKDVRTPLRAKLVGGAALAYLMSPIDLIPDFIPLAGQLDDLLIVPAGLWLARRMIPPQVLAEARARVAAKHRAPKDGAA